jgi:hypothetical protein
VEGLMPTTMLAPVQKKKKMKMGEVLIRNGGTGQFAFTNDPILAHSTNTNKQVESTTQQEETQQTQTNQQSTAAEAIKNQSWWDSTNAFSLFGELQIDDEEDDARDLKAFVRKQVDRLRRGNTTAEGWKLTVDDLDAKDICSAHDIFNIQIKCKYLSIALELALEVMSLSLWTWSQCCLETVTIVN